MQIIDSHIHPALTKDTNYNFYGITMKLEQQFDKLKQAGISKACGSVIKKLESPSFDEIKKLNDMALKVRDMFPDFYIPGIHIHPHFPEESCREIERCCGSHGVRWIGELVGYFMEYKEEYATTNALEIFKVAEKYNAVVNIHAGTLEILEILGTQLPDVNFVFAHPGNNSALVLDKLNLLVKYKNLHLDISGTGIDRYGMLRTAIDIAGYDKILFGTDFPINNPAVYVHGASFEMINDEERKAVFAGNFRRLTGL